MNLNIAFAVILAIFVFFNAKKRKNNIVLWPIGTFVFWPLILPFYMAKRNLLPNEKREGGSGWNVCKYFILTWTGFIAILFIAGLFNVADSATKVESDAEAVGASIGILLGAGLYFIVWILPVIVSLILGLILKKNETEIGKESIK